MSDIFREVEEEVRREQYRKLWDRYGFYAVSVAVLVILAVAGFTLYRSWQHGEAEAAADIYERASTDATEGKLESAVSQFTALRADGPAGYAAIAGMRLAAAMADANQPAQTVALYEELIQTITDPSLKAAVAIKLAWMVADIEPVDQIKARVAAFTGDDSLWRHAARELLAYQEYRAGRFAEAKAAFEALSADAGSPRGVKDRADRMVDVLTTMLDAPDAVVPPAPDTTPDEAPDAPAEPELTPVPTTP
ncbi:MAG TPA: tetratricopeptide repeat protein [Micropepsaceae bacterium]|nr:tetratricopeptide repeat protein [Micropepsaceae bacterium]